MERGCDRGGKECKGMITSPLAFPLLFHRPPGVNAPPFDDEEDDIHNDNDDDDDDHKGYPLLSPIVHHPRTEVMEIQTTES